MQLWRHELGGLYFGSLHRHRHQKQISNKQSDKCEAEENFNKSSILQRNNITLTRIASQHTAAE